MADFVDGIAAARGGAVQALYRVGSSVTGRNAADLDYVVFLEGCGVMSLCSPHYNASSEDMQISVKLFRTGDLPTASTQDGFRIREYQDSRLLLAGSDELSAVRPTLNEETFHNSMIVAWAYWVIVGHARCIPMPKTLSKICGRVSRNAAILARSCYAASQVEELIHGLMEESGLVRRLALAARSPDKLRTEIEYMLHKIEHEGNSKRGVYLDAVRFACSDLANVSQRAEFASHELARCIRRFEAAS